MLNINIVIFIILGGVRFGQGLGGGYLTLPRYEALYVICLINTHTIHSLAFPHTPAHFLTLPLTSSYSPLHFLTLSLSLPFTYSHFPSHLLTLLRTSLHSPSHLLTLTLTSYHFLACPSHYLTLSTALSLAPPHSSSHFPSHFLTLSLSLPRTSSHSPLQIVYLHWIVQVTMTMMKKSASCLHLFCIIM